MHATGSGSEDFWRRWRRCAVQVDQLGRDIESGHRYSHPGTAVWVAMCAIDGAVPITGAAHSFVLPAGSACLIPPGFAWSRTPAPKVTVIRAWFQIFTPPAWTDPLQDGPWPAVISKVPSRYLDEALACWGPAWIQGDGALQATASHLFALWLTDLLRCATEQQVLLSRTAGAPGWLTDVLRELVQHRNEHGWSVAGLARCAGVNPTHLADTCRRYLGESPGAILRRERVAFAISLLRSNRVDSVEQASAYLGYSTPRAFWRCCVAETGQPPSYWLKN